MHKTLLVSVLVSTAMAGTAVAGRAKAKWCPGSMGYISGIADLDEYTKKGDVAAGLNAVIKVMCDPDHKGDDNWAPYDDAYRKLSAQLGLGEEDWADVVEWATAQGHDSRITAPDPKKPWSKYDSVEQFAGIERNFVTAGNKMGAVDAPYFVDALGANLTETGRLGWIAWCLDHGNDEKPVISAMCQPDIEAFDAKKVTAELRASKGHSAWDRMKVRLALGEIGPDIAAHAAKVKKLVAKDPVYGQMFDIAKKARADWEPSADLVALEVSMEDALVTNSRKASDGCAEKTTKAVLSSVSKVPAKAFALHRKADEEAMIFFGKMTDVIASGLMSEPDPYLAMNAFAICRDITKKTSDEDQLIESLARDAGAYWAGFRGPRTAAQTRIFQANLQPDDRDAKIEFPQFERLWFGGRDGSGWRGSNGVLTKVSSKAGQVHVEFQQKKHQEYVSLNCKKTGRIQAIRDNGDIVYEETCSDSKLITSMEGPGPIDVPAEQGKGLKAGMFVNIVAGYVLTAWPAKSDTPSVILGQPVK